jgi:hypothetical protein
MRGAAIGAAEKPQTGAYRESMAKDCAGAIGTIERERRRAAVGRTGEKNGPCDGRAGKARSKDQFTYRYHLVHVHTRMFN